MSSIVYPDTVPLLIRLIGGRWRDGRRAYRMRWGELSFRRGLALSLDLFEEGYSLHLHALFVCVYIKLPFLRRWAYDPREMMESWGFTTFCGALHLRWGERCKVIIAPWNEWAQVAHDVLTPDGTWVPFVGSWEDKEPDGRLVERYPYNYLLRSGEVQRVEASVSVERRVRKLRWLRWLPFARVSHAIAVEFSDEVGERAGSWKGGCIGCGYELRPDETPQQCLKRMESERKF